MNHIINILVFIIASQGSLNFANHNQLEFILYAKASFGNEGGHAGDPYAFDFVYLGTQLLLELEKQKYQKLLQQTQMDIKKFKRWLNEKDPKKKMYIFSAEGNKVQIKTYREKQHISSQDLNEETLSYEEVDVLNFYPEQRKMLINRTRWRSALLDQKLKLVLHEYFCLLKLECDTFEVSVKYIEVMMSVYSRLLADHNYIVRYYGRSIGNPPLSFSGNVCSEEIRSVTMASSRALSQAKTRCETEQKRQCTESSLIYEKLTSSNLLAFEYCEITALYW